MRTPHAALFGALKSKPVIVAPRRLTSKGQVKCTVGYLETSFLPLRTFTSIEDLQAQHDAWAKEIACRRSPRRLGARVADAYLVERDYLSPLPGPPPETDQQIETRISKDAFVRVAGADYPVPPGCSTNSKRLPTLDLSATRTSPGLAKKNSLRRFA